MLNVAPDFERRIDLPGAGPCLRPVEIDRSGTGFCTLVALRIYSFAQGVMIDGEAEGDEVFIIAMRGAADIAIMQAGVSAGTFALDAERGMRAAYMPPHAAYRLTARSDCDIAYARSSATGAERPQVRGFAAPAGRLDITDHAQGMDLVLVPARAGEVIDLGANARLPERFVHVRAHGAISASLGGTGLGDWSTAALAAGEAAALTVEAGTGEILLVAAATNRGRAARGVIET